MSVWRDEYGYSRIWIWAVLGGMVMIALVGVVCLGGWQVKRVSCDRQLNALKADGYYSVWTGCMVRLPDGREIDIDKYRVVIGER